MSSVSIGFVAKRSGVSVATLHFYEQKNLIKSWRTQGNQRRYERSVLRRVAIIKTAQTLGFSLKEIALSLNHLPEKKTPDKEDWTELSTGWKNRIDEKIKELMHLRNELDQCIGCGCLSLESCRLRNPEDTLFSGKNTGPILWKKEKR